MRSLFKIARFLRDSSEETAHCVVKIIRGVFGAAPSIALSALACWTSNWSSGLLEAEAYSMEACLGCWSFPALIDVN